MSSETDRIEADIQQSRTRLNDTLDRLGHKLSPGQIVDDAVGLAKGQAGRLTSSLGRQAMANPIATALIAAGVGMLFMPRRSHDDLIEETDIDWDRDRSYYAIEDIHRSYPRIPEETDETYGERLHEHYADALSLQPFEGEEGGAFKNRVSRAVKGALGAAKNALGGAKSAAAGAIDGMKNAAAGAADAAASAADGAKDLAGDAIGGVAHAFGGGGRKASHLASGVARSARRTVKGAGRRAAAARHDAEDFFAETPLAAGAIAVAVGAMIGGAAPLSNPERKTLRPVADKAARAGAGLAEKGANFIEEKTAQAADRLSSGVVQ